MALVIRNKINPCHNKISYAKNRQLNGRNSGWTPSSRAAPEPPAEWRPEAGRGYASFGCTALGGWFANSASHSASAFATK